MKKINLIGCLSMALTFLFISCSQESTFLTDGDSSIVSKSSNVDCGECEGQITYLELEYLGSASNATVKIYEGKVEDDKLFQTFNDVNNGSVLIFSGSKKNDKMGSKIHLTVNDGSPIEIHTSCSQPINVGMTFGDFLIQAGASHEGGALCTDDNLPPPNGSDCGECDGQITYLELEYLGVASNATIKVYEGKVEEDKLFQTFNGVNNGSVLIFSGSKKDNKMGSKIHLTVNDGSPIEIHTSCSQPINAGMTFGDFLIQAGSSHEGGALCTDDNPPGGSDGCSECEGQMTYLELEFLGSETNAIVNVYEGKVEPDKLFKTFTGVNSGSILAFSGSKKDNKMGSKIHLTINGSNPIEIHTSCSQPIYVGMNVANKYLIKAGTSHEGGNLPDANGNCEEGEIDKNCLDAFAKKLDDEVVECVNFRINGEAYNAWSSYSLHNWLLGVTQNNSAFELPIYIKEIDDCNTPQTTHLGHVEFSLADNLQDIKIKYVLRDAFKDEYFIDKVNLYVGSEVNPYNADGTYKLGITNANFYSGDFVQDNDIIMPWTSNDPYAQVNVIPHAKICKIQD